MRDRSLELLRKFVISGFPVSIETLCEEFKLSQRTLRSEIKSLNDYLVENEFPIIETIRGKGFLLTLSKSQTIDLMGLFENDLLNCNIKCIKNFKNLYRQRITQ
jgi:mannitol operon transcriptional antiterminator